MAAAAKTDLQHFGSRIIPKGGHSRRVKPLALYGRVSFAWNHNRRRFRLGHVPPVRLAAAPSVHGRSYLL